MSALFQLLPWRQIGAYVERNEDGTTADAWLEGERERIELTLWKEGNRLPGADKRKDVCQILVRALMQRPEVHHIDWSGFIPLWGCTARVTGLLPGQIPCRGVITTPPVYVHGRPVWVVHTLAQLRKAEVEHKPGCPAIVHGDA